jgi:hypothetical protein
MNVVFYGLFNEAAWGYIASNERLMNIYCEGYKRKWSWKVKLQCLYYTTEGASVTFRYRYYVHYKQKHPLCIKDMVGFYVNTKVYSKYNSNKNNTQITELKFIHVTKKTQNWDSKWIQKLNCNSWLLYREEKVWHKFRNSFGIHC